ncbi:hypothetical protein QVD17_10905 [Tagetes erecta]|uniref:Stress up-regulated Nod 19 protein n=1 Tax=Tagetes erecta TaxID=13708 RepID=A0AAD8L3B4_TARER|nr:hypothetical protein QVD17_10905 [Tagetes erecta]
MKSRASVAKDAKSDISFNFDNDAYPLSNSLLVHLSINIDKYRQPTHPQTLLTKPRTFFNYPQQINSCFYSPFCNNGVNSATTHLLFFFVSVTRKDCQVLKFTSNTLLDILSLRVNMLLATQSLAFLLVIVVFAVCYQESEARVTIDENGLKTMVYLSPKITQHPGSVSNKFYYDIEFPKGHIAIKSFNAEVVDEAGDPVSLQETYLHHWVAVRYYHRTGVKNIKYNVNLGFHQLDFIIAGNDGICDYGLPQFFGLGSETRKTSTDVPDPYGIEVGNQLKVPAGYEERWMFNIHAIDTRGAVDAMGCTECRCDLYNVTEDEYGRPLKPNYAGGLHCCYDGTQCKVKNGLESVERDYYLKYTVTWVDWSESIIPVKVFIFDVTDTWQHTGIHDCLVEYDIENGVATSGFTNTRKSSLTFPIDSDLVYGVAHQHSGGIGSALYGEDGRVICSSKPIYGKGNDAGDEAGYIVGMTTCYPKPGSMKIAKGETLTLECNYSSEKSHTGVMGLFYILVADSSLTLNEHVKIHEESKVPILFWGVAAFGLAVCAAVLVAYQRRMQNEYGYLSIAT